jgi:hypothetical protein
MSFRPAALAGRQYGEGRSDPPEAEVLSETAGAGSPA